MASLPPSHVARHTVHLLVALVQDLFQLESHIHINAVVAVVQGADARVVGQQLQQGLAAIQRDLILTHIDGGQGRVVGEVLGCTVAERERERERERVGGRKSG